MKLSEAIAKLEENPKLKFTDGATVIWANEIGFLAGRFGKNKPSLDDNVDINAQWQQVQEPVDFMTAVNSGKRIRPANDDYKYGTVKGFFRFLGNESGNMGSRWLEYINGPWYIEP